MFTERNSELSSYLPLTLAWSVRPGQNQPSTAAAGTAALNGLPQKEFVDPAPAGIRFGSVQFV